MRVVASGESLIFSASTRVVIERFAATTGATLPDLTDREQDVLRLLARGRSNQEIGVETLCLDGNREVTRRVDTSSGVRDRTQAVIVAYSPVLSLPAPPWDL